MSSSERRLLPHAITPFGVPGKLGVALRLELYDNIALDGPAIVLEDNKTLPRALLGPSKALSIENRNYDEDDDESVNIVCDVDYPTPPCRKFVLQIRLKVESNRLWARMDDWLKKRRAFLLPPMHARLLAGSL